MPRKATTALTALLVFGTASVVLADTNADTNRGGNQGGECWIPVPLAPPQPRASPILQDLPALTKGQWVALFWRVPVDLVEGSSGKLVL